MGEGAPPMSVSRKFSGATAAFFGGMRAAYSSVFILVISGTYVGIGALTHGYGLSSVWLALSTVIVWAAPAQVILITALATGGSMVDVAIGVTMTAIRLFPMVVVLLPLLRRAGGGLRELFCRHISRPSACGSNRSGCCHRWTANTASHSATACRVAI